MLNNNEECNWSSFLEKPLEISLATLSKYMKLLISNGYVEKKSKGIYGATPEGRKRYFDLRFKDSFDRKLRYPPEIILNKRNYDHIILWMLFNNDFCNWVDFLEKPLSINNNSLSKNSNILLEKDLIVVKDQEYRITKSGEEQFNKILKTYRLDYQTVLKEEIEKIEDIKEEVKKFLEKYDIDDSGVELVFLNLINHLEYSRIKSTLQNKENFYKILLFLSMNHPSKYPKSITPESFALNFRIEIATLNYFVRSITEENLYQIKFFKIGDKETGTYYFQEHEKLDKMMHLIIDENILKYSYLNQLEPDLPKEEKDVQAIELLENIVSDISDNLFKGRMKRTLWTFLPDYINYFYYNFQREYHSDNLNDKFKGLAFENITCLNLEAPDKENGEGALLTTFLKEFPKYAILDELKKKIKSLK